MAEPLPPLDVTVFSDYICPFCYVGDRRLARLAEQFDLNVSWRPVEIHPTTPAEGMPVEALGYPKDVWEQMMSHLNDMAAEEGIRLAERRFTTNSHKALLLVERAKEMGGEVFERLHGALFFTFFSEGRNIGDETILKELALNAGMGDEDVIQAFEDDRYEERLRENYVAARRHHVTGVPTFVIGGQAIPGAVPVSHLIQAAETAAQEA